ncbi:MAG TPA: Ig-like domain-containing protein [Gemmatimonadaceae bacterium]|nr:Ig-like domain-containing protein [Gemmatimonadaceae bacterium]
MNRLLRGVAVALLMAACGGGATNDNGLVTPPPTAVLTTVTVTLSPASVAVGSTATATATGADQHGAAIGTGTVTWSVGTPSVASVTSGGVVTGLAAGTTTIVATAGTKQGQATLTVTLAPVAQVTVSPAAASVAVGATQQLTAVTLDAGGHALTGRAIAWTTSDATRATVSNTGLVTGVAAGTATITATSEGHAGAMAVTVTSGSSAPAPTIASIAPAVLTPGAAMTITGTGFSASAVADSVTIDGVKAAVTAASVTQLTATVPALACTPTHAAAVRVTVGGQTGAGAQTLRVGTPQTLAVGGSLVVTSPSELACLELPATNGTYLVSVFSDLQTPTALSAFRLAGGTNAPVADRAVPVMIRQSVARPVATRAMSADVTGLPESEAMHMRVLEASRSAYAMLRGRAPVGAGAARTTVGLPALTAVPAVGTTRAFRVNQFTTTLNSTGSCASYKEITARAVYVGTRDIIWEDVAAPLAGTMDSYFTRLGQEFDATMYRSDSTYFGDPLATDPYTDADQHLDMVFTPSIPTGIAGFVISCDLFPRDSTTDPSSNFGEYFYAVVPTVAGTGFTGNTADAWLRTIRKTVVHEVKHLASFGARLTNGASSYEESWLEEGMAREAEEVWLRNNIYNVAWKGDATYAATMYCDVRPSFPECTGAPYGLYSHMTTLYSVLLSPGASSLFGRVADNDFNFYALAWSFSRWADDRYGASDAGFLRGITQATATTGMASIAALTGQPVDQMLGHWVLSLYLDGLSGFTSNADVQFPTWNTRNLYAGMSADFSSSYPANFPLSPQSLPTGAFAVDNGGIHGGAFAMYELTANGTTGQTLALLGTGGVGPAASGLRIAIARMQ